MNINNNPFYFLLIGAASFASGFKLASKLKDAVEKTAQDERIKSVSKEALPQSGIMHYIFIGVLVYQLAQWVMTNYLTVSDKNEKEIFISLNEKINKEPPVPIGGKKTDKKLEEIATILTIPQKTEIRSLLILGDPGVGKSSIVDEFVRRLVFQSTFESSLKDTVVYKIDCSSIVSGTAFRGTLESRIEKMKTFMLQHKDDGIFFLDEFHQLNADHLSSHSNKLPDYFKDILTQGERVIGGTTNEEYKKYVEPDRAFDDRFKKIRLQEPSQKKVVQMLMNIKKNKYEAYGMTYEECEIKHLVNELASREGCFPRKAIKHLCFLNSKLLRKNPNRQIPNSPIRLTIQDINESLAPVKTGSFDLSYYS